MIGACPGCGYKLKNKLNDGLSNCTNCNFVFSSTISNELLAAAWQIRKNNLTIEQAQEQINLQIQQAQQRLRVELVDLVMSGMEKVIQDVLPDSAKKRAIEQLIAEIAEE